MLRPSDGKEAKNIAFIQCAGSRDENHLKHCSRICCMASLKQTQYVREAYGEEGRSTVYYIDIRAIDRLEDFYQGVHKDPTVKFVKSKVANIKLDETTDDLVLHGVDTEGYHRYATQHDLVVLAVGMEPESNGIALPADMLADSSRLPRRVGGRRPVFRGRGVESARREPRGAERHGCRAARPASHAQDIRSGGLQMSEMKTAAYICSGCGLGDKLDASQLVKIAQKEGKMALVREHEFLCSDEGVKLIRDDIANEAVTHIAIAACSRRAKTEAFHFPEVAMSRANLREGVIWVVSEGDAHDECARTWPTTTCAWRAPRSRR